MKAVNNSCLMLCCLVPSRPAPSQKIQLPLWGGPYCRPVTEHVLGTQTVCLVSPAKGSQVEDLRPVRVDRLRQTEDLIQQSTASCLQNLCMPKVHVQARAALAIGSQVQGDAKGGHSLSL